MISRYEIFFGFSPNDRTGAQMMDLAFLVIAGNGDQNDTVADISWNGNYHSCIMT